ncbi:hypothetical protein ACQUW1_25795, partial [Klebsiella pneumoniae]
MLLRFRVLPLVFVISLLSGCGLASKEGANKQVISSQT